MQQMKNDDVIEDPNENVLNIVSASNTNINTANPLNTQITNVKNFYKGEEFIEVAQYDDPELRENANPEDSKSLLGLVSGVVFPSMQNIFGTLLFLRAVPIMGEAGIGQGLVIVGISVFTCLVTCLSMSAIVTNGKIKRGGSYYMISRSLGPALGGSVGFLFFCANAFGAAMYIMGAIEALIQYTDLSITGSEGGDMRVLGYILAALLVIVNIVGINAIAKTGTAFLIIIQIALVCMYLGIFVMGAKDSKHEGIDQLRGSHFKDNWKSGYDDNDFFALLAIYFPSATGWMAGANRSADLRDPSGAIPKGTLIAQFVCYIVYLSYPVLCCGMAKRSVLMDDDIIFAAESSWPSKDFTTIAIILSSTGAALQCLASAPRIYQAICEDDLIPFSNFFKKSVKRPLIVTTFICAIALALGSIDAIAPIQTMFFLMCYLMINTSCAILSFLNSPNWRPTFRFYSKYQAILGIMLCIAMMVMIDWIQAIIAFFLMLCILIVISKNNSKTWGDQFDLLKEMQAVNFLYQVKKDKRHVKIWRPSFLTLCELPETYTKERMPNLGVLTLLKLMKKGQGINIAGFFQNESTSVESFQTIKQIEKEIEDYLEQQKIRCIAKCINTTNVVEGFNILLQSSGLGAIEPNSVLIAWPKDWNQNEASRSLFMKAIETANLLKQMILVVKPEDAFCSEQQIFKGNIDIWSFLYEKGMKEYLVHLLKKNKNWKQCNVRLFVCTTLGGDKVEMKNKIASIFKKFRLLQKIQIEIIQIKDEFIEPYAYNKDVDNLRQVQPIAKDQEYKEQVLDQNAQNQLNELHDLQNQEIQKMKIGLEKKKESQILTNKLPKGVSMLFRTHEQIAKQAKELNQEILKWSKDSDLILTNLPQVVEGETDKDFLRYCEILTQGLPRVLMNQNTDTEVLTQYT